MTTTPSKSASEHAALVLEARERFAEWAQVYGSTPPQRVGTPVGGLQDAGQRLAAACSRLADALEAANADTQRLDWLEAREHTLLIRILWQPPERGAHVTQLDLESGYADSTLGVAATFREAIDAARAAEETGR